MREEFPPFRQSATIYILYSDTAVTTSQNKLYHIDFLPHSQISLDSAYGNAKFSTDTHFIRSGELTGQSGKHLLGLRRRGGHGLQIVVAHEIGEVITGGNEV